MSRVPFDLVCDSANREPWLEARLSTVGASEAAAVLGEGMGSALELWAIKTGKVPAPDLDDNEAVFWGLELESSIVRGFAKRTGRVVVPFGLMLRSRRWPWLSATPDAFTSETADDDAIEALETAIVDARVLLAGRWNGDSSAVLPALLAALERGQWFPLQIKNIGLRSAEHWADGVPAYYRIQCVQEALVCGAERTCGAALIAGQRLAWDDVDLDVEDLTKRRVINLTQRFMVDHVEAGVPPDPDGSESARQTLGALYPREAAGKTLHLGAEAMQRAYELEAAKDRLSAAKAEVDLLDALVRAELKDAEMAVYPDGSAHTLKQQTRKACTLPETTFRVLRRKRAKS